MSNLPKPTNPISDAFKWRNLHGPGHRMPMGSGSQFSVSWASHLDKVRDAQRLRFSVFAGEMGARLSTALPGHDIDRFDDYCEHLLVRDKTTQQVIGTYRVLTPNQADRIGETYIDTEFDLARLEALPPQMLELGRSCVHPSYRNGIVILALWRALGEFMVQRELEFMIGCASIPMLHNGVPSKDAAASVWNKLSQHAWHPTNTALVLGCRFLLRNVTFRC